MNDVQRRPLVNCIESYLELTPEEAAEFEALGHLRRNREIHTMALTWEERMMAKGREEGLHLGREEGLHLGREEGRREGLREARQFVLDLLDERFGAVPDRIRRNVGEIPSLDRLHLLAKKVLTAHSLEELGLG